MDFKKYIASIPDFPQPGVLFRDITPLMSDGEAFHAATSEIQKFAEQVGAEVIAGPESRGFIFGCPVAANLHIGFVPVRKPGKLPRETISYRYDLEYGSNELHMHKDAITSRMNKAKLPTHVDRGTEELGGVVVGCAFLIELEGLKGREALAGYEVFTLMSYE